MNNCYIQQHEQISQRMLSLTHFITNESMPCKSSYTKFKMQVKLSYSVERYTFSKETIAIKFMLEITFTGRWKAHVNVLSCLR